jgi:hypothetical protein
LKTHLNSLQKGIKTAKFKLKVSGLGCSLVVQHFPNMREALGSIPAPKKKKDKKKKKPLPKLKVSV